MLEFGSVNQLINLKTSKSLSRVTTSLQKQTIVFMVSITMVIEILEMRIYLLGLQTSAIKSECIITIKLFISTANKLFWGNDKRIVLSSIYLCCKLVTSRENFELQTSSLAKWLSVRLRTKWFWVRVQLQKTSIFIFANKRI